MVFIFHFSTNPLFAQDDGEIINIDSSLVILNAAITNSKDEPEFNLKRSQFEIYEDGNKQEISVFETQKTPYAAIILIDTSGSMEQRVSLARSAAINFLDGIRPDDNVAIYNFDSKVKLVQKFSNLRDLFPQVFDLKASGMTVLNDAVYAAAKELEKRPEKRRAIIVLSDGADTRSGHSSNKALNAALDANATIYTVDMSGINLGGNSRIQNQGVLKKFANRTGGRFISTPGGTEMREAFKNIVEELGSQYTLGYYPTNTKKDGKWRKIELKITDKKLNIRTREGYEAPKN
ncbi:MAG: VWA domain-containing protein [Aridibacter sp.]